MKLMRLMVLTLVVYGTAVLPVVAQEGKQDSKGPVVSFPNSVSFSGASIGVGIGAAFTIVGAGYGFGKIGAAALESMARQPEVAGRVQTGMLIIAALLEGATFFSLIVCILLLGKANF